MDCKAIGFTAAYCIRTKAYGAICKTQLQQISTDR